MVLGINDGAVSSGALLYLVSSTLTISAFFMLIELVERGGMPAQTFWLLPWRPMARRTKQTRETRKKA